MLCSCGDVIRKVECSVCAVVTDHTSNTCFQTPAVLSPRRPGALRSCLGSHFAGNAEQAEITWLTHSVGIQMLLLMWCCVHWTMVSMRIRWLRLTWLLTSWQGIQQTLDLLVRQTLSRRFSIWDSVHASKVLQLLCQTLLMPRLLSCTNCRNPTMLIM